MDILALKYTATAAKHTWNKVMTSITPPIRQM